MNTLRVLALGIGMFLQAISGPIKKYFDDKKIKKAQSDADNIERDPFGTFVRDNEPTKSDTDTEGKV